MGVLISLMLAGQMSMNDLPAAAESRVANASSVVAELNIGAASCESAGIAAEGLSSFHGWLATINSVMHSPRSGDGERYRARKVWAEIFPSVPDAQLNLADALLRRDCLNEADALYREIQRVYSGQNYDGLRDRANTGIDDVRAARGRQ